MTTPQASSTQRPSLSRRRDQIGLLWDMSIIGLVVLNLSLIVFDSLFAVPVVSAAVLWVSPAFHAAYATWVHANFATIDLGFVAIFICDVLLGWAMAIRTQRYPRWFHYPLVHWYDVLGCIPLAGFRWLRVLRIIALGVRMQRLGLIDVRGWSIVASLRRYYDILVEEVSDRVVVKVLDGVQHELRSGASELPRQVVREVVRPRQALLVGALAESLATIIRSAYADYRQEWRAYIRDVVHHTIERNAAARGLGQVPVIGENVLEALDSILTDVVSDVMDSAIEGLGDEEYRSLITHIVEGAFDFIEREAATDEVPPLQEALIEVVELLKQQVQQQNWRTEGG